MPGWDGAGNFVRSDGTRTGAAVCQEQQIAGTTIDPVLFDNELNTFASGLENCVTLTGETTPTANLPMGGYKLTGLAAGSSSGDSVRFEQLAEMSPVGCVQMYAGPSAPSGWLLCDGSAVSRTGYALLFSVVGVAYGSGDGSTTFNLPDLRQRFPLGKAASGTGATLGSTGGSIDHTHGMQNHTHSIASHTHTMKNHTHTVNSHSHTMQAHTHSVNAHDHTMQSHTHTVNSHSHGAGSIRGLLGGENSNQGKGLFGSFDGVNTWNPTNAYAFMCADLNSSYSGNPWGFGNGGNSDVVSGITTAFSLITTGSTDGTALTTNGPSTANTSSTALTTNGPSTANTSSTALTTNAPSDNTTDGTSLVTGAPSNNDTTTANPPYIALNFIIKT